MRTQDLVSRLAGRAGPIERNAVARRLNRALMAGLAGNAVLLVTLYGIDTNMPEQMLTAMFWIRLAFPLAIMAAALRLAERLARPGAALGLAWTAAIVPTILMLLVAAVILFATPSAYRLRWTLGATWAATTANAVLLSLPSLAAVMHAMKGLAPTRLAVAGAGAGLLAGAQGLLVYSVYCADMPATFWSVWHVLAVLVTMAIGAGLAPGYLRW
ncbi:DUF1109 domain-containing protein [Achromobacter aloeverae]|uniref:DUF1109 domain-containing protein n=1 Tax=Achromobacter aloeverae TaxID=1750518 RepID=A0A4Q1HLA5_9BURK|nr:DUF1109 domain-containing protein [Achromobacter aloeverae]RXN91217.1 DUF1109 domain-containing protein [Achromobacter aloeverae]